MPNYMAATWFWYRQTPDALRRAIQGTLRAIDAGARVETTNTGRFGSTSQ